MLEVIEKLLILQDRDRKILRVKEELSRTAPERQVLQTKAAAAQNALDTAKNKIKQIESDRKKLELDAESKKQAIEKYSVQQFQTKKNDEYRAFNKQIEDCKSAIVGLEDQEIVLMEQAEAAQKTLDTASRETAEVKKAVDSQLAELAKHETQIKAELVELEKGRAELTPSVEPSALARYEHLLKQKGDKAIVGISHGACGGCHMRLPIQVPLSCKSAQKSAQELTFCPSCGRILYWTSDMNMTVAD
jgi:uncharacterized protein